jgi:hypothetical protein
VIARIALVALALAACGHGSPAPASGPRAETDRCKALTTQFKDTLAKADAACADASDCAPIPTGVVGCCQAADAATARALSTIADQMANSGCEATIMCPAVECEATCDQGQCR